MGTPRTKAWHQTLQDLDYHATVLDIMGTGKDLVMVIYGDASMTIALHDHKWVERYHNLPDKIKNRLVLENYKSYSIVDCLNISKQTGIPFAF